MIGELLKTPDCTTDVRILVRCIRCGHEASGTGYTLKDAIIMLEVALERAQFTAGRNFSGSAIRAFCGKCAIHIEN